MALRNSSSVGVNHENRMLSGVEQNRVGSFGTYVFESKEFIAEFGSGLREHFLQRTAIGSIEECHKQFEASRLLAEVTRGADQCLQTPNRDSANPGNAQYVSGTQFVEREFNIRPVRILREIGSDDDLKLSPRRPPMLWPPRLREGGIHSENMLFRSRLGHDFSVSKLQHGCLKYMALHALLRLKC